MALVVEVKGGAAVETIGSTLYSCRSRLNKSNHEAGAKMHLCTISVSADRTVAVNRT